MHLLAFRYQLTREATVNGLTGDVDYSVPLVAEVEQDGCSCCDSELLVIWTPETLAKLQRLDFSAEELLGAIEAAEQAHWDHEAEQCRLSYARQRLELESAVA